jgi:hypothetical protein
MRDDDLDRILSEEILPSSGFVSSVMEAVRREAMTPPPIPFPWKRALPGLVVAILALLSVFVLGAVLLVRAIATPSLSVASSAAPTVVSPASRLVSLDWIVLVLLLTLSSILFSMRLARAKA